MEKILIAEILKPHGIKGEIKAKPVLFNDDRLKNFKTLFLDGEKSPRAVKGVRLNGGYAYFYLEGVISMNDAELLRGRTLSVNREDIELPEGIYMVSDLINSKVISSNGTTIGVLTEILQNGSADVYVVTMPDGKTLMFPLIKGVADINIKDKQIIVSEQMIDKVGIIE